MQNKNICNIVILYFLLVLKFCNCNMCFVNKRLLKKKKKRNNKKMSYDKVYETLECSNAFSESTHRRL